MRIVIIIILTELQAQDVLLCNDQTLGECATGNLKQKLSCNSCVIHHHSDFSTTAV